MYDLCIIGGGINGVGIARDAAGRGYRVLLLERDDLGSLTSSASTKLIHGGLRYLETFSFRLVRESLRERETLLRIAPHLVHPFRFVLPHRPESRPAWMIRLGLFLYDRLGGARSLPPARAEDLAQPPFSDEILPPSRTGFSYSDCLVDDSRLVVLNAADARERGADILTRTACAGLVPVRGGWVITARDTETGEMAEIEAKVVVNAAGPCAGDILDRSGLSRKGETPRLRLVQGSHIVVPALFPAQDHAYILQQPDRRIVFAIPYQGAWTLIGTTDTEFAGDARETQLRESEIDYLCAAANRYFRKPLSPTDIVWSYSGVRALVDDGHSSAHAVTRDYLLHPSVHDGSFLLSVFGGKLTTYRRLAEEVCTLLDKNRGEASPPWTALFPLPGGDLGGMDFPAFLAHQRRKWPGVDPGTLFRQALAYGSRMDLFLGDPAGEDFGAGMSESELSWLVRQEWARTAEDVLWRRTKLGLFASPETVRRIQDFMSRQTRPPGPGEGPTKN